MKRTHTCGELRKENVGQRVTLCGWVGVRRDHGGVVFIDLRDRYGIVQVVFNPELHREAHEAANRLRTEFVIQVSGKVENRPEGTVNSGLDTGEVEVMVDQVNILNMSETPPFEIDGATEPNEDLRLKYRYLDLRKNAMKENLIRRHKVTRVVRDYFDQKQFLEIETPMLTKSTPEGARDYLVPSRVHHGNFYALPQSPQLFKQLLMSAGMDRYYQLVKCFRDEDLRADRQPEHTQIDVEMSFVDRDDILDLIDGLIKEIFDKVLSVQIQTPIARLSYQEAIRRFGSDKPDLRFGMEIQDLSDLFKETEFKVFRGALDKGGTVRAIKGSACAGLSLKEIDELIEYAKTLGAKGLAWMKVEKGGVLKSSITKFFDENTLKSIQKTMDADDGDLILFAADAEKLVCEILGGLRLKIAKLRDLIPKGEFRLVWIIDFPLFEYDEKEDRLMAVHHPFTSPKEEDEPQLEADPLKAKAQAYDLVINGVEVGGGSIRIHQMDLQSRMFKLLGISDEEAKSKFGFLLDAFSYGTPPHGGVALGLDRLVMLLSGLNTIRDTIAFPKTQSATCLMTQSPNEVSDHQLKELGITIS